MRAPGIPLRPLVRARLRPLPSPSRPSPKSASSTSPPSSLAVSARPAAVPSTGAGAAPFSQRGSSRPTPGGPSSSLRGSAISSSTSDEMPMMPDDAQKCADSLQTALVGKNVHLPQPNSTCDTILCFCGIRLHQISSLSCPAAFNVTTGLRKATPTTASGTWRRAVGIRPTRGAPSVWLKGSGHRGHNETSGDEDEDGGGDRAKKMFDRDCQLMGLTWLLARNKMAYIPTVSAVLRAMMYSRRPPHGGHGTTAAVATCSPDQENMPLAVDSLELERSQSSSYRPSINAKDSHDRWIRTIVLIMIASSF
ncbi:hypothetical protein MLD38_033382 [Melastoma candidum]|uniref:Uncharacterized protein n=1 Tax=Melastoma candidum TaxID=119954 RepID=A0ACB9M697_9MYRT|nr:hypothetical protein MLD38_033382 [Melastoma candidum]